MSVPFPRVKIVGAFFLFVGLSLFLLKDILTSPGLILGSDWGLPLTPIQIKKTAEIFSSTWQFNSLLSGRNFNTSASSFFWGWELLSHVGVTGAVLCKLLLLSCFVLAGFSLFLLLHYLGLRFLPALVGGVVYMTTPVFFNYSIMGWTFVLLVCGLIPLACIFFIEAVSKDDLVSAIIVGFLFSIAFLQSQTILWFPLLFLMLGLLVINDIRSLKNYFIKTIFIIILFVLLNQPSFLPLIMCPDKAVSGSDLINSSVSLGTTAHFFPRNIIRLFGGLFNYQYESILEKNNLSMFGFAYPLMAIGGLFSGRHKKIALFFLSVSLVPFGAVLLNHHRWILQFIPFSNILRDFPRFSIFSSFGFSALAAIFINEMSTSPLRRSRVILFVFLGMWVISLFPWWTGQLTRWDKAIGPDNRLRTKVFPSEYFEVERDFSEIKLICKALYLPAGGFTEFLDGSKYMGPYQGAWDIFAAFSPLPGALTITDRRSFDPDFQKLIVGNLGNEKIKRLVGALGYVVLRKNMLERELNPVFEFSGATPPKWLTLYYSGDKLDVYKVLDFVPLFIVPNNITFSDGPLETLKDIIDRSDFDPHHLVIEERPAYNLQCGRRVTDNPIARTEKARIGFPKALGGESLTGGDSLFNNNEVTPVIEYRRLNLTKYRVRTHGAGSSFFLAFNEGYHSGWRLTPVKYSSELIKGPMPIRSVRFDGNEDGQASERELNYFVEKGWVSTLGTGPNVDFVSKNFHGTIQNNNLPQGAFFETWVQKPFLEDYHFKTNASVNGWLVPSRGLCESAQAYCRKNPDGTFDLEMVIEFRPQRFFYIALAISGVVLLGGGSALLWGLIKKRGLNRSLNRRWIS